MNGRIENVLPSVIGISNDIGYKESIQSKTDSSLRLKEITFKQYDANQLNEILTQRAQQAFVQDDVEKPVSLAAAFAKQEGGDARYGIDLLQKAGMKAKKQGDSRITEDHIREAHEEYERDRVYEVTEDLSDQEKMVLAAVMYHDLTDETPIERKDLYPTYQRFSRDVLGNTNSSRMVADYLKKMAQLGLLRRKDGYEGPGESGFVYDLEKVDYNMIMQALGPTGLDGESSDLVPEELATAFNSVTDQQTTVESWEQSGSSS
jgi:cell division control protein 6